MQQRLLLLLTFVGLANIASKNFHGNLYFWKCQLGKKMHIKFMRDK